jgi:hypothetical protein
MKRKFTQLVLTLLLGSLAGLAFGDADDLVREQKVVMVDGVRETWKLEWDALPQSVCGPEDVETALTCPCSGVAYGEAGKLFLVRTRPGTKRERLELTPFYNSDWLPDMRGLAFLQRWRPIPSSAHDEDDDWHHASDLTFLRRVKARGLTELMRIADYNHDGLASEFLVQVGTRPCGKNVQVLVGLSRTNPHLHVFASAQAPDEPLELFSWVWEAVRKSAKPVHMIEWACGDHMSSVESSVTVATRNGVFQVQHSSDPCPEEPPETPPP